MNDNKFTRIRMIVSSIILAAMIIFAVLWIIFAPRIHDGDILKPHYGVNDPGITSVQ